MRTPLVRTLGVVWLCALVITVLSAVLTAAIAIVPGLPVPLPLAGASLLAAAILALLAAPLALAPGHALSASLAAPEGTPIWGTDRPDLWGDLARAALGRAPPPSTGLPSLAEQRADAAASLLRTSGEVAAGLQREAAAAGAALQGALQGAARIDSAARHVEARLAQGLGMIEHVNTQLAALRPSSAEAVAARAEAAVAAVEQAVATLRAAPPVAAAAAPAEPDLRVERALVALADAVGRLAARPDPLPDALRRLEETAASLAAAQLPAPPPEPAPIKAIDPALPDRLEAAATRLAQVPDIATPILAAVTAALEEAIATPVRALGAASANVVLETGRLDVLATRLEAAPAAVAEALAGAEESASRAVADAAAGALAPMAEATARLAAIADGLADLRQTAAALGDTAQAIAAVPPRFDAAADSLAALPLQLEARISAGAARIQEAAAALGTAAAGAVAATHRATSRAAEELLASAETARAGLANAVALTDQAAAAQRALRAAAEHLAALGAETHGALKPRAGDATAPTISEMLAYIDGAITALHASPDPDAIEPARARA